MNEPSESDLEQFQQRIKGAMMELGDVCLKYGLPESLVAAKVALQIWERRCDADLTRDCGRLAENLFRDWRRYAGKDSLI